MTHNARRANEISIADGVEETQERFTNLVASLVRNSSDIITVLDREGRFRFISDSLTEVLGWRIEELIGQLSFPYIHPDDREGGMAALGRVIADPSRLVTHRYRLLHQDGHFVPIEGRASNLLADPFVRGILINSRDITHRLEEEEVLRRSQAVLEQEVESRTAEIRAANLLLQREIEERRQGRSTSASGWPRPWPWSGSPGFSSPRRRISRPCSSRWEKPCRSAGSSCTFCGRDDHRILLRVAPPPGGFPPAFGKGPGSPISRWASERLCRNERVLHPGCRRLPGKAAGRECAGYCTRERS